MNLTKQSAVRLAGMALKIAAVTILISGCGRAPRHDAEGGAPVPVSVLRVGADGTASDLTLPARVKAREEVTLTPAAGALLTALPFAEGANFARGQALARFEAPETREALEAARAADAAAEVRLENARRQDARMDSLLATRVASVRESELAHAEHRAAEAARAEARAALEQASAASTIAAPFAGRVVRHRVDVGTRVGQGQPVLDVRSDDGAEIETPVPESWLDRLGGARASFQIGDGPWRGARIVRLEGMTDFESRTRTAYLKPSEAGAALEPGAYARVRFEVAGGDTSTAARSIVVPARSLVRRGALAGVFVVHEGRASLRWLRLGRVQGDRVDVLAGLEPGEEIALEPANLADGRAVEVRR